MNARRERIVGRINWCDIMCEDCWKDILKNDEEETVLKDIFDRDDFGDGGGLDYGSRQTEDRSNLQWTDRAESGQFDTQEEQDRFHEGIKCFYCDEPAEWKCINGLTKGCAYEGPSNDGVQVCGANSNFADTTHPEGHKTYALNNNSGHTFVPIEEYFDFDPNFGYAHGDHRGQR